MTRTQLESPLTDNKPMPRAEFVERVMSNQQFQEFIRAAVVRAYEASETVEMTLSAGAVLESWLKIRAPNDLSPLGSEFPIRILIEAPSDAAENA